MQRIAGIAAHAALFISAFGGVSHANVVLSGPDLLAGSYAIAALSGTAVTAGTATGVSLWSVLGGATSATSVVNPDGSTTATYGGIVANTPAGDNGKNAILRYFVVASNAAGQSSVISLGEIDPFFGGTASTPVFIQTGTSAVTGSTANLIVPNQPGRDIANLTSLVLMAAAAAPSGAGGVSSAVQISGNVNAPGGYDRAALASAPNQITVTATGLAAGRSNTDTYTGPQIYALLNPVTNDANQIVVAQGTDGYEVVYALDEFDTSDGGNANALVPYSDTGTVFPGGGIARTVISGDSAEGRWESNLASLSVEAVPEPGSLTVFCAAAVFLGLIGRRRAA